MLKLKGGFEHGDVFVVPFPFSAVDKRLPELYTKGLYILSLKKGLYHPFKSEAASVEAWILNMYYWDPN